MFTRPRTARYLCALSMTVALAACGGDAGPASPDVVPPPVTVGNGVCDAGETAINAPADCPAAAGDGACTHSETPASTPQDCPPVAGDGLCTHDETPTSVPADCSPRAGDGVCSDGEDAETTPQDCPPVAGDGLCTHGEDAEATPQDCPPAAGDGLCTHDENAQTTPQDCPPIAGDGFCTHDETFATAPNDCPAPDVTFNGGSLDDLRSLSRDLVFGDLRITGELALESSPGLVHIRARNVYIESTIRFSYGTCEYRRAPSLTIEATGLVRLAAPIRLGGRSGVRTTDSATCNSCTGTDGGNVELIANRIETSASIDAGGGRGSQLSIVVGGQVIRTGCDGGDAGNIVLNARSSLEVASPSFHVSGGSGGSGSNGSRGDPGSDGALALQSPATEVQESDPNATLSLAHALPFEEMSLVGRLRPGDDGSLRNRSDARIVTYTNGTTDFIEDMYRLTYYYPQRRNLRLVLSYTPRRVNLFLYVLNAAGNEILAVGERASNGDLVIDLVDAVQGDVGYIGVSQGDTGVINDVAYRVTISWN